MSQRSSKPVPHIGTRRIGIDFSEGGIRRGGLGESGLANRGWDLGVRLRLWGYIREQYGNRAGFVGVWPADSRKSGVRTCFSDRLRKEHK